LVAPQPFPLACFGHTGGKFNVRVKFDHSQGKGSHTMSHIGIIKDYRLTTAKIYYHLPDYPGVLQTYVWQEFDVAPEYPALHKFLDFWKGSLDGKLHSVEVAAARSVRSGRMRHARHMRHLH
jgi:uncharacterized protein Usg